MDNTIERGPVHPASWFPGRLASRLFPAGADLLQPGARDELVALRQGMDAIPAPSFGRDGLCRGIENGLGPDMDGIVVFDELLLRRRDGQAGRKNCEGE